MEAGGPRTDMATVPEILLATLEDLQESELRTFKWYLCSDVLQDHRKIPRCQIEGADRMDVVDLLVETYGSDSAIAVTLDILPRMKLNEQAKTLKEKSREVPSTQVGKGNNLPAVQENLKSFLKEKYQNIYEGSTDEGDTIYLNKIYTELHLIEGARGGVSEEHEVRQLRSTHTSTEESSIKPVDIFKPWPGQEKHVRTILTQGIAGVGKTICVQKYVLSWAEGEENQDISLLFPLPFRELNPNMDGKDYSLMDLLHQFFPEIKQIKTLGTESKILFIFDGLDECLLPLNFKHNKVLRDEAEPASLDVLITNLIAGDLLGNALVWITSRPAAASRIPRKHIHQWTEIRGFSNQQKEEYFKRRLCDENLADTVINHVKSSRSLYIMCHIPVFCWITVTVMKKMMQDNMTGVMPNTLTEIYAYLLICQTDRMRKGDYPMESNNVVLKLAKLAFRQLEKGKLIFYQADLEECGMDVKEAITYSGVCTEIFAMEGRGRRKVFSFVHLTIQEFLAAVYAHHSYIHERENFLLGYLKRFQMKWLPKSLFNFHKTAIDKALQSQDGHWDLFLRFLLGLSRRSNQELLSAVLDMDTGGEEETEKTIQFIKERIKEEPETKINLFHCLSELKEESLVQEIQSFVSSGRLSAKKLSPVQWSALTFELMTSEATQEEFDLKKYIRSEEGVVKLQAVITSSTRALLNQCNLTEKCCEVLASALSSASSHLKELDLSDNNLKDSGVKLLSAGLGSPHCTLEILRLNNCKLEGACCEALAGALSSGCSRLRELDLSNNDFTESGVKALCVGLRSQYCKLETVRLNQCKLNWNCCEDLASVFSSKFSHLKQLDLSNNSLQDPGVKLLSAGLTSPNCTLQILRLSWCSLTEKSCDHIALALSSESSSLRDIDLSGNDLQDPGLKLLAAGLGNPHCKLKILRLKECKLKKCCETLASVLRCGASHLKELNLSGNDLQDSQVKLLSEGLRSPNCRLEILRLSFCGVTEVGCTYLALALRSNPSHLRQLDLSYNYLQDSGVKLISSHLDDPLCKLENLSVDHNARCYLKSTLKTYAGELTLDGNTAAKSLLLCEGGKRVSWVRELQQYPDHPERFDSVPQVLCHQGLTQCHYWEVEWCGRWVDIAVATRGIRRQGSYHLCGFGSTDQSWSLCCSEDHYSAQHNHQSVDVPAPSSGSHRVGVFLDWLGGTLSFYSVSSGTLNHLHTFSSMFTEPLFPGFRMAEDNCSVAICTMEDVQDGGTFSPAGPRHIKHERRSGDLCKIPIRLRNLKIPGNLFPGIFN
ncbi:NACHT, LRR and PYD domains-containing protein 12-like [Myripristis murdjan]|uniref:NACHT, LRR and PYD domains-containing protein 12-like n=1 Tax=Myripristis murdjan TaxID=586833 RepID=UPI001175F83B|nr:NACHT, LRR and PYD domains-containing protein 12-like [Myripristis murdjan]